MLGVFVFGHALLEKLGPAVPDTYDVNVYAYVYVHVHEFVYVSV